MSGLPAFWRVHWSGGGQGFEASGPEGGWLWSSGRVPCLLSALSLCLWCAMLEYGSVSRFEGVFRGFYVFRVGLLGLGALRGLWGFCVRVRLGGFRACCVFCLSFSSFLLLSSLVLLSFCSCPASLLGFCSWSLGLLVLWLLVFFPFRTASDIKRRGANCVPSCGRVLLY